MIARGDIVWVDYGVPRGSAPAKVRPAIVLQSGWLLESKLQTIIVVPLTTNTALDAFPGNVLIPAAASGLTRDSVANVTQVGPVSREFVEPYAAGSIPAYLLAQVASWVRLVMEL